MNKQQNISPEGGEEINLLELLRVIVRNMRLIAKLTTTVAVITVISTLCVSNKFTATATLLPPAKEAGGGASVLLASMGGGLAGLAGGLGGSTDLYLGILKSRTVTDAVIKRLDLQSLLKTKDADSTRKKLAGVVKFQAGAKDGIISIAATYEEPVMAARLANTFVEELQRRSTQLNLTKASTERSFLEKRLAVVRQDLKNAEEEMKSFQMKNKSIKADDQARVAIEGIAKLKAELITGEVKLAALRNSLTDESAEVKTLLATVAKLRSQLGSLSGTDNGGSVIPSVGNAPSLGVEYVRRLRELKTQEALYEQLTKQYELAKMNEARDSSSIQVLDEAVPPLRKSAPSRAQIVLLATVAAFFGSLFLVFIREYLAKLSPEDSAIVEEIQASIRSTLRSPRFSRPER